MHLSIGTVSGQWTILFLAGRPASTASLRRHLGTRGQEDERKIVRSHASFHAQCSQFKVSAPCWPRQRPSAKRRCAGQRARPRSVLSQTPGQSGSRRASRARPLRLFSGRVGDVGRRASQRVRGGASARARGVARARPRPRAACGSVSPPAGEPSAFSPLAPAAASHARPHFWRDGYRATFGACGSRRLARAWVAPDDRQGGREEVGRCD